MASSTTNPRSFAVEVHETDLEALIPRMRSGDPAALGQLYDATLGRVYGLAVRVLKQPQDAEEVVGDVFLQAWDKAGTYCPERGTVMAWLLTLTWSRAIDRLRRQRRQRLEQPLHPEESPGTYLAGEDGPADLIADRLDRLQMLQRAFQHLSPTQRTVLELAYQEELSQPEIAQRTGLPLGTVKSHARRGLTALKAVLLANGDTP